MKGIELRLFADPLVNWILCNNDAHAYTARSRVVGYSSAGQRPLTSDRSFLSGKQIAIEFPAGLDDAGRARLTEIASVLERRGTAAFAVALGFIQLDQWPEPDSLCIYPLGSYASSLNLAEVGSRPAAPRSRVVGSRRQSEG